MKIIDFLRRRLLKNKHEKVDLEFTPKVIDFIIKESKKQNMTEDQIVDNIKKKYLEK